jgi:hypothetical protein
LRSLLIHLLVLVTFESAAVADKPNAAYRALPKFWAGASAVYTNGETRMSSTLGQSAKSTNVAGGQMWLAGCGCGDVSLGSSTLALGVYADFTLGINASTSAAVLASLSFGPQLSLRFSDDWIEVGVRYRAAVSYNGARDVGGGDDLYLLDVLARYRNLGADVRHGTQLFAYPLFGTPSHPLDVTGVGAWYRIADGRISSYYLRIDVDHWSPRDAAYRDYDGIEGRATLGYALGF